MGEGDVSNRLRALCGLGFALLLSVSVSWLALGNRTERTMSMPPLRVSATLGTVSMDGGSEAGTFEYSGVPYGVGNYPSIIGTLLNKLGKNVTDMTFRVADPSPPGTNLPALVGGSVKPPGAQDPIVGTSNGGNNSLRVGLGDHPIGHDESGSCALNLNAPADDPCTTFKVYMTPSVNAKVYEGDVDVFEVFSFSGNGPFEVSREFRVQGDSGALAKVQNLNQEDSPDLIQVQGTYSFGTPSNAITNVYVLNAADEVVSGAIATITGAGQFTISNLALGAGQYYSIVLRFEVVPLGNTALELVATFAQ